jgi:NADPH:quinone reductase-like Zn-dependent oxidoreductase
MRAIQQTSFGGPEVLTVADIPEPAPRAGRTRIRVTAAAVNPVDIAARAGWLRAALPDLAPPFIVGSDFAGTVLDGDGPFAPGARVAGLAPWFVTQEGTYAEVISVEPAWLAGIPDPIDDVTAAAVPLSAQSAAQALDLAGVGAGQTVLITGASGAVGGFAVQHAVARGARVAAVASHGDTEYVAGLGAEVVLPRTEDPEALVAAVREQFADGVDAVVDPAGIGGPLIGAVRDGGVFVAVLATALPDPERGVDVRELRARSDGELLARVFQDIAAGALSARVGLTLPLERADEAHRRTQDRSVRGKIVLTV